MTARIICEKTTCCCDKPLSDLPIIGAVVMASGSGQRFQELSAGQTQQPHADQTLQDSQKPHADQTLPDSPLHKNKLLADFRGKPMIVPALHAASSPLITFRTAVTRTPEIRDLCGQFGFPCLLHDRPGLNDTIRLGLQSFFPPACRQPIPDSRPERDASIPSGLQSFFPSGNPVRENALQMPDDSAGLPVDGCLFLQGDQPLLSRTSVEALIRAFWQEPQYIYRLSFDGRPGSPVLFPKQLFEELLALPRNCGGSFVIRKHPDLVRLVEAADAGELLDADTPLELKHLQEYSDQTHAVNDPNKKETAI